MTEASSAWIACNARMPDEGVAVLIVDIDNEVDIARWDGRKWFTYSRISWARKSVAHWQPLPTVPPTACEGGRS